MQGFGKAIGFYETLYMNIIIGFNHNIITKQNRSALLERPQNRRNPLKKTSAVHFNTESFVNLHQSSTH